MKKFKLGSVLSGTLLGVVLALPVTYGLIDWKSKNRGMVVNQWRVSFRTGDFGHNYLLRAAIAVHSLGNAIPQEAMFFHGFYYGDGTLLNGENNSYEVVFPADGLPPVDAFWSLTVYDADNGFMVENPIDRYTISSRTEGVTPEPDGSLRFILSAEEPSEGAANWLPVKKGGFTVTLRTYLPRPELMALDWKPPAIQRIEGEV